MNNQSSEPSGQTQDEPFVSRQQYRQQQSAQRRQQSTDQEGADYQQPRRQDVADERDKQIQEEKTNRLKRRLNIAIIALVAAIIVVYLILFYVG